MPDKFDPYREALVMEEVTLWPEEFISIESDERLRVERLLHDDAQAVAELQYLRSHTGFCRQITVTQDDLDRLGAASAGG